MSGEVKCLSEVFADFLNIKMQYIQNIFKYLPIVYIIFIGIGIIFTFWGYLKWLHIQKTLDQ